MTNIFGSVNIKSYMVGAILIICCKGKIINIRRVKSFLFDLNQVFVCIHNLFVDGIDLLHLLQELIKFFVLIDFSVSLIPHLNTLLILPFLYFFCFFFFYMSFINFQKKKEFDGYQGVAMYWILVNRNFNSVLQKINFFGLDNLYYTIN